MIEVNAGKVERAIEKVALYAEKREYIPEVLPEVQEKICVCLDKKNNGKCKT